MDGRATNLVQRTRKYKYRTSDDCQSNIWRILIEG